MNFYWQAVCPQFFGNFIDFAEPVIDAGFADMPAGHHFAEFLQRHILMVHAQYCNLAQFLRQCVKADRFFNIADIFHLAESRPDRFIQIGRFAIDEPVDGIAHIPDNPDIFKPEQGMMGADNIEKFRNLFRFF